LIFVKASHYLAKHLEKPAVGELVHFVKLVQVSEKEVQSRRSLGYWQVLSARFNNFLLMESNFFKTVVNFFSKNPTAGQLFNDTFVDHLVFRSDALPQSLHHLIFNPKQVFDPNYCG
jgi:hypothetical protein